MKPIDDILKGKTVDEFFASAEKPEIKNLFQVAQYQRTIVLSKIEDAETRPDYRYSADENDAYILRLGKLNGFLAMIVARACITLSDINHKEKMQNKRDKVIAERFNAFRKIVHKHCSIEVKAAIFAEYNPIKAEIENKYFPEKEATQ